jgi:proline iminopeptidase
MIRRQRLGPLAVIAAVLAASAPAQETHQAGELFPVSEPFDTGLLKVSDLHSISYARCGNPAGKPAFVLHGGPGIGCYPRLTQYFNPKIFHVVLHDQRGAGRSRPAGELRENTTQHLVADIERLREHLKIDGKILVFGGSWGSTLALAYAETHPEQVSGMVLRGVFTGTKTETDNAYAAGATRQFFPDAVARLEAALPPDCPEFKPKLLLELFKNGDDAIVRKVGRAWIRFAIKTGKLHATDEQVEQGWGDFDPRPGAQIDCHYASNGFFLEEGQLLRDAHKIKDIPITIINGRYDMVCPPITAWRLHQRLPRSKLIIVEEAGHSEGEDGTTRALVEAVAEFE